MWGRLISTALVLSGCALNRQGDREVSRLLERHGRELERESERYGSLPQRATTTEPARGREASQTLSKKTMLAQMIGIALDQNPDIQAAAERARSKASRVPQATALPDPFLSTKTLPEPVRTAEGDNYFVLGLRQKLPVPEKLDRRGRIALEETRLAIEQLEQTRLRVIGDVKRAYFQLYAIDWAISITEENMILLRDLIVVTRGQLVAGRGQQEDVLRTQVELSNLESELVGLRQRRVTTVSLLNALLDRPVATPVATPPDYDLRRLELRLDHLLALALGANPELKVLERQIARDEQSVKLSKLEYWPDFTIGLEWMQMDPRRAFRPPVNPQTGTRPRVPQMSEDGSDNWAILFGFNIPLWFEKIEAGIREARQKLAASRRQHASMRNTVTFRVEDALARVRSFRDIATLFATAIIPQAEQAYIVSRTNYMAGTSDFQYVIDNWQRWLFFRIRYYHALGEVERSVADLEQAVGISIVEADEGTGDPGIGP
jgi:outer membrane protein TolC